MVSLNVVRKRLEKLEQAIKRLEQKTFLSILINLPEPHFPSNQQTSPDPQSLFKLLVFFLATVKFDDFCNVDNSDPAPDFVKHPG